MGETRVKLGCISIKIIQLLFREVPTNVLVAGYLYNVKIVEY